MDVPRVRLRLRVSPGARRPAVVGRHGTAWKVRVSAPPEGGKANDAVLALLSETLHLPSRDIELVSGASARDKVVALRGVTGAEVEASLSGAAERSA